MPAKKKTKTKKTDRQPPKRHNVLAQAVAVSEPVKLVTFAVGDRVSHPQFGAGTIVAIEGSSLSIAFDAHGARRIIDSYVKRLKT